MNKSRDLLQETSGKIDSELAAMSSINADTQAAVLEYEREDELLNQRFANGEISAQRLAALRIDLAKRTPEPVMMASAKIAITMASACIERSENPRA